MRKLFIVLLCMLALFAVVSCKNEPKNSDNTDSEDEGWESDVLIVSPAEGTTFSQTGKFQFTMKVTVEAGKEVGFLAKFSDDITKITPRQGEGRNTKWMTDVPLSDLQMDEDGWYIIVVPAEKVILQEDEVVDNGDGTTSTVAKNVETSSKIALSVGVSDDTRANCWVAIKDLYVNGDADGGVDEVDFSTWVGHETEYVEPWYTSPAAITVQITE